jgi:hypothetical protein
MVHSDVCWLQADIPGRWDLTATEGTAAYPMWIEILASTTAGRLQSIWSRAATSKGDHRENRPAS